MERLTAYERSKIKFMYCALLCFVILSIIMIVSYVMINRYHVNDVRAYDKLTNTWVVTKFNR